MFKKGETGLYFVKGEIKQPAIEQNTIFFKYAAVALLLPYIIFPKIWPPVSTLTTKFPADLISRNDTKYLQKKKQVLLKSPNGSLWYQKVTVNVPQQSFSETPTAAASQVTKNCPSYSMRAKEN